MDIFPLAKNSGSRPDEWNRKLPRGAPRKLNFYPTQETEKLPSVNVSPSGQVNSTLTWTSKSSHQLGPSRSGEYGYYGDPRDKKKTVARRHLIGSLSAPMKTTTVVRTTSIGRSLGSPPRGYPDVRQTFDADHPASTKPGGDHLQGIDKINNIFQKRLDLKVQKPAAYDNMPTRVASTSLENRKHEHRTSYRPLFMTTDVGKLSDVNDMLSEDVSQESLREDAGKPSGNSQHRRAPRNPQISQYRPLTPNLMKKLNNMKLSAFTTTQLWVNQLPQEAPVFNRQLSKHGSCADPAFLKNRNNTQEKILTRWIYGGER